MIMDKEIGALWAPQRSVHIAGKSGPVKGLKQATTGQALSQDRKWHKRPIWQCFYGVLTRMEIGLPVLVHSLK
jgi:hypothetical protein